MQLLNQPLSKRVQIQGHRGGFKPENTMASFKQAVEHGLDAIELDVININFHFKICFSSLNIGMAYKGRSFDSYPRRRQWRTQPSL